MGPHTSSVFEARSVEAAAAATTSALSLPIYRDTVSLEEHEHEVGNDDQQQDGRELVLDHSKGDGRGTSFIEQLLATIDKKPVISKINKEKVYPHMSTR